MSKVTKKTTTGQGSTSKFVFGRRQLLYAVLITAGIILGVVFASIAGSVGQIEEANDITFTVRNGRTLDDLTSNYSVTVYTHDISESNVPANFEFYREWNVSINGTASNALINADDLLEGFEYIIRFQTNLSGYGYFSDFCIWISENGKYLIGVYEDVDYFNASIASNVVNGDLTTISVSLDLGDNPASAIAPFVWDPFTNGNLAYDWVYMNITADDNQGANFLITPVNGSIQYDTVKFMNDRDNNDALPTFFPANSSQDTSYAFFQGILKGWDTPAELRFTYNNTIANVTSLTFFYGKELSVALDTVVV